MNIRWLWRENPPDSNYRFHSLILRGENVLSPAAIRAMAAMQQRVAQLTTQAKHNIRDQTKSY